MKLSSDNSGRGNASRPPNESWGRSPNQAHAADAADAQRRVRVISFAMIPCTLRQLEIFIEAAEDCHFVRTANRLGISQAAISTHIAALEKHLGKRLFIRRRGTKPVLSSSGYALLREAKALLAEAGKIQGLSARRDTPRTSVRLGAGRHLLDDCIKRRLSSFYSAHRDVELECDYVDTLDRGVQLIKDGKKDLLVFTVRKPGDYRLHSEVLRPVRFGLYAGGELAAARHASPAEIAFLPFILPPEGSEASNMVHGALLDAGIACRNIAARAQFIAVAKDLAKQGVGIIALYETMVKPEDEADLVRFDVELPTVYRTLFRAPRGLDRRIERVEAFLRDALAA